MQTQDVHIDNWGKHWQYVLQYIVGMIVLTACFKFQVMTSDESVWLITIQSPTSHLFSPFHNLFIRAHASGQQVVPVVQQLVIFAAVSHPDVWDARHAAGHTQQVLPGAAVLVCNQQALVGCLALGRQQKKQQEFKKWWRYCSEIPQDKQPDTSANRQV